MKRNWFTTLVLAPLIILITLALQSVILLLPYPLSSFNVVIFVLIFALLIWESGNIVWFTAVLYGIIDWYTATPYGLILIASVLAMLTVLWFYRSFFTNRSPVSAAALTAFFSVARFIYFAIGFYGLSFLTKLDPPAFSVLFTTMLTEVLVTSPLVFMVYLGVRQLVPALKVTHTTPLRSL